MALYSLGMIRRKPLQQNESHGKKKERKRERGRKEKEKKKTLEVKCGNLEDHVTV